VIIGLVKKFFQLRAIGMDDLSRLSLFAHPYKINESVCQEENDNCRNHSAILIIIKIAKGD
jgi:hypothetical protein